MPTKIVSAWRSFVDGWRVKPNSTLLAAVLVAVGTLLLPIAARSEDKPKVAYECTWLEDGQINPGRELFVYIDYSTNTAAAGNVNDSLPVSDYQARTWQSAQVSASTVKWTLWGTSSGVLVGEHYSLNRITGDIHVYSDLMQLANDYKCVVNSKLRFPNRS